MDTLFVIILAVSLRGDTVRVEVPIVNGAFTDSTNITVNDSAKFKTYRAMTIEGLKMYIDGKEDLKRMRKVRR